MKRLFLFLWVGLFSLLIFCFSSQNISAQISPDLTENGVAGVDFYAAMTDEDKADLAPAGLGMGGPEWSGRPLETSRGRGRGSGEGCKCGAPGKRGGLVRAFLQGIKLSRLKIFKLVLDETVKIPEGIDGVEQLKEDLDKFYGKVKDNLKKPLRSLIREKGKAGLIAMVDGYNKNLQVLKDQLDNIIMNLKGKFKDLADEPNKDKLKMAVRIARLGLVKILLEDQKLNIDFGKVDEKPKPGKKLYI